MIGDIEKISGKRRGRLVVRESKWQSSYNLASLFSSTGVASTIKLLSAMFVSTDNYTLGSVDISDANLQVEQDEATIIEVNGKLYELRFTLPGQRTGSSAWCGKLLTILEKGACCHTLTTWRYLRRVKDSTTW